MSETKIKVNKDKLIEAIRARKSEAEADYQTSLVEHPAKISEWQKRLLAKLDRCRNEVEQGEFNDPFGYNDRPPEPPKPTDTVRFDRHIAMLEMSPEETVTVNTEDFGRYLR